MRATIAKDGGGRDESRRSAREIVPLVMEFVRPARVIDVGCGAGDWLAVFMDHGVTDVWGVDADWRNRTTLRFPADRFIPYDLRQPFRSNQTFDLAMSLEVAEHLPAESAQTLVDTLVGLAPVVLFSAAIPFQGGLHHLNEQWPDYWAERFRARDYGVIDCLRRRVWENDHVAWWYAQNLLLFVRESRLADYPELAREAQAAPKLPLAIVHPTMFLRAADPRHLSLSKTLAALPAVLVGGLRRRAEARFFRKRPAGAQAVEDRVSR